MTAAEIDLALAVLDGVGDEMSLFAGFASWDTGLTIADLRELLEAARNDGWLDAEKYKPEREIEVVCETHEYGREEVNGCYDAESGSWFDSHDGRVLRDVRRWRELL